MIIRFLFSSPEGDISLTREDLEKPLLISPSTPHPFLMLGDYFDAARAFLLEDNLDSFLKTLFPRQQKRSQEEPIAKFTIRSEKQGALYHVASIEVEGKQMRHKYSLLTAMTEKARKALERESNTLATLGKVHPSCGLPRVYFRGDRDIGHGNREETFTFLLEEWLEGYHEWHISRNDAGKQYLRIWDQKKGYYIASGNLYFQLFRQASRILTMLYDPETACQVRPWHHAAGDFVISNLGGKPRIRLTTARGYEPLLRLPGQGAEKRLANLLFFFLDMGLQMRLDRLDGVGELTWIGGNILSAVMVGFFEALTMMIDGDRFGKTVARDFLDLLRSFSPTELISVFEPLLEIYRDGNREERELIEGHLPGHVKELFSITGKFPLPGRASGS